MTGQRIVTGTEASLTGDDQIKIALQKMIINGGKTSIEDIYQAVEEHMNGYVLSEQGKASLRTFINRDAVEKDYVHPYDSQKPGWYITPRGRQYIDEIQASADVEEEEILGDEIDLTTIHEPYDPSQIRVELMPFTVFQVMRMIELKEINLQPDFQRHIVWDQTRQSRLIESILIRIPLPAFYLDAVDDDEWLVVDGLQRLSTLDSFYNKNKLRLRNLEFLCELEGKTFRELPRNFQRQIEDKTKLNLYVIQPGTPANVKFTIFYRINTGGLVLTSQEIRHALFHGKATELLHELASTEEFRGATTNSIQSKRMDDRECILRFFAFYFTPYTNYKKADLDSFLSQTMQDINAFDALKLAELRKVFTETMCKAEAIFGTYAFRKMYEIDGRRSPISKSLFEVWSVSLAKYKLEDLVRYKEQIIHEFVKLMNEDMNFGKSISQATGNVTSVQRRFQAIENLLTRVIP